MEDLIQEAVEAAGVNADLPRSGQNELNNLANKPQMNVPLLLFTLLPLEAGAPPSMPPLTGDSIIVIPSQTHRILGI